MITAILMDFAHNKRALTQLLKAKKVCHGIIFAIYDIKGNEVHTLYLKISIYVWDIVIPKYVNGWNNKKKPSFFHHSFVLKFSIGTPSLPYMPLISLLPAENFLLIKKFNLPPFKIKSYIWKSLWKPTNLK